MPRDGREWVHFVNELQKWVVDLDINGRLTSDRNMPQALLGNMGSVQTTLPVTATDAGASASVTIDSHVLSRSSGDVTYNAGSITGLTHDTTYYIYVDDEDFEGGAVTYQATADKAEIVNDLGRYFVSEVTTPAVAADDNTGGVGAGFAVLENDLTPSGLPAASTTSKGVVELATTAEVDTGTDATRAITPDALEASIYNIVDSSPTYTPTNAATDRSWDANAAAGAISSPPTQAEVENIRDSLLELSDVVATQATDLQAKNVFG
jgi:hypothetical protein